MNIEMHLKRKILYNICVFEFEFVYTNNYSSNPSIPPSKFQKKKKNVIHMSSITSSFPSSQQKY